ncbi:MAG: hypothetical protein DRG58_11400, partial [Deltaproteobacteria bacterium]
CHPLSAANKLILAPGLLTGTAAANSGRISVGGKSRSPARARLMIRARVISKLRHLKRENQRWSHNEAIVALSWRKRWINSGRKKIGRIFICCRKWHAIFTT